eukprot:scaffold20194_cov23-Tisochrysis_lutea.AAC.2
MVIAIPFLHAMRPRMDTHTSRWLKHQWPSRRKKVRFPNAAYITPLVIACTSGLCRSVLVCVVVLHLAGDQNRRLGHWSVPVNVVVLHLAGPQLVISWPQRTGVQRERQGLQSRRQTARPVNISARDLLCDSCISARSALMCCWQE